jgi:hypothetical protein
MLGENYLGVLGLSSFKNGQISFDTRYNGKGQRLLYL